MQIPLFPLTDVVHSPATELRLRIVEPRYRQLVRDVRRKVLNLLRPWRRLAAAPELN